MYKYKHFLNFKDIPDLGIVEILEPIGFDASSHKVEQSEFFGRDVVKADEKIDLAFTRDTFGILTNPIPNIDGIRQTHLSNAFDWILNVIESYGWETEIEWTVIDQMGATHVVGIIDVFTAVVEFDSIKFNVIQHTNRELIKRRKDVVVNAWSDKDLDGNPITPCTPTEIIMVAKPTFRRSKWTVPQSKTFDFHQQVGDKAFNFSRQQTAYEIEASYPVYDDLLDPSEGSDPVNNYRLIFAKNTLNNVKITYDSDMYFSHNFDGEAEVILYAVISTDNTSDSVIEFARLWDWTFPASTTDTVRVPAHLEHTFFNIPAGCSLSFYWFYNPVVAANVQVTCIKADVTIEAESVAFDSVIRGVRLIDLIRHNVKAISGLPVISPKYDKIGSIEGEHYNNFAFNGYMLADTPLYPLDKTGGLPTSPPDPDGKPFNNAFEDLMTVPMETCHGHQINRTSVEILPYEEFYTDIDLGGFITDTNSANSYVYDKDYFLKTFTFKYSKSSDERETNGDNTIDDVHTQTQRLFASKKTDGNKNVELKHVRSHFLMELQRKKAIEAKKSTLLQYDETLFVVDCVQRNPSDVTRVKAVLLQRRGRTGSAFNFLELLNTSSSLENIGINWVLMGLRVGTIVVNRLPAENAGTWRVISVTPTVLRLELVTATPWQPALENGNGLVDLEFTIPGVLYIARTTEGFVPNSITGVHGPNKYANLRYAIGRNLKTWGAYIATAAKYLRGKDITTTEFKVNGTLSTQMIGETKPVSDSSIIKEDVIRHLRRINPIIHKVTVIADCDTAMMLLDDIESKKGFIRVQIFNNKIIKGYPKKIDYIWSTNQLVMELQEANGRETVRLTKDADGIIYIDEVGYPIHNDLFSYEMNYDFIMFRDSRRILIMNPTHWRDIEIDGVTYTDKIQFMDALNTFLA